MTTARCFKCKAPQEMKDAKLVVANGRARMVGTCPKCGTKMSIFTKMPVGAATDAPAKAPAKAKK